MHQGKCKFVIKYLQRAEEYAFHLRLEMLGFPLVVVNRNSYGGKRIRKRCVKSKVTIPKNIQNIPELRSCV
jgi:hypothetical protein